jgi:hypothetical protein
MAFDKFLFLESYPVLLEKPTYQVEPRDNELLITNPSLSDPPSYTLQDVMIRRSIEANDYINNVVDDNVSFLKNSLQTTGRAGIGRDVATFGFNEYLQRICVFEPEPINIAERYTPTEVDLIKSTFAEEILKSNVILLSGSYELKHGISTLYWGSVRFDPSELATYLKNSEENDIIIYLCGHNTVHFARQLVNVMAVKPGRNITVFYTYNSVSCLSAEQILVDLRKINSNIEMGTLDLTDKRQLTLTYIVEILFRGELSFRTDMLSELDSEYGTTLSLPELSYSPDERIAQFITEYIKEDFSGKNEPSESPGILDSEFIVTALLEAERWMCGVNFINRERALDV